MFNYIPIDNKEVDALISIFENSCQSSGPLGKNILAITLRGDKCDIVYGDQNSDHFLSPFFALYFKEIWWPYKINGRKIFITVKTDTITARRGYNNILVRYAVEVMDKINPIMLNGRISKLFDKKDLDKRVVEEIQRVLKNCDDIEDFNSISEENLDISYRTNLNKI